MRANGRRGFVDRAQLLAIGVMVGGLVGSSLLTLQLAAKAGREKLVFSTKAESGMTREEALGIAAGAFRGLFVNMLWLRAQRLKEDGKYWEATDLARTITRLQPRFPRAWAFHGWNLAYNISVATQTLQERWQWVNSGIRLMRNEAIPRNPNDMLLHRELAWILFHKVQGRMDDANNFYKVQFAREWTIVVGPPPERTKENRDRAVYIEEVARRMDVIAQAKDTPESLREAFPLAGEMFDKLVTMGYDLRTGEGRMKLLEQREMIRILQRRARVLNTQDIPIPEALDIRMAEFFGDLNLVEKGLAPLLGHIRKRTLIDQYNMEPDRMARYTRKYGPLDWRHPAAHSLYWAARGVEQGLNRVQNINRTDYDFINTDRLVIHSIQELYRTGAVQYDFMLPERFFVQMPNPDFIQSYDDNIQELLDRENEQMRLTKGVDMESRVYRFYSAGYENFLSDAIVLLYRRNQIAEATRYKDKLASWEGRNKNDFRMEAIRTMSLEEYVQEQIIDRSNTPYLAMQEVYGSLQGAFYYGLLAGDDELFRSQYEYAVKFHRVFFEQQFRITNVDPNAPRMAAMDPNFNVIAAQVLFATIQLLGPIDGSVIYNRAPAELQRWTYYFIEADLSAGAERQAASPSGAAPTGPQANAPAPTSPLFPKPEGYDAFRSTIEGEMRRQRTEQGQQQIK
jgi:hypothetical protein